MSESNPFFGHQRVMFKHAGNRSGVVQRVMHQKKVHSKNCKPFPAKQKQAKDWQTFPVLANIPVWKNSLLGKAQKRTSVRHLGFPHKRKGTERRRPEKLFFSLGGGRTALFFRKRIHSLVSPLTFPIKLR